MQICTVSGLRASTVDGREILTGVDLSIGPGEVHVLMGPNGAGKSTLGKVMMGSPQYVVTAGSIVFHGEDVTYASTDVRARAGMFMSFQDPPAIEGLSLESFLRTAASAVRGERVRIAPFKKELDAAMKLVHMDPSYAARGVNEGFSGGERKKAELLQMLILKPALAILDEMDSGLDVDAIGIVRDGIAEYLRDSTRSLLVITHRMRLLEGLPVDYTHVMEQGQIIRSGDERLAERINECGFECLRGEKCPH